MNREARLKKRYAAEQRFKLYGIISILTALFFVGLLLFKVFSGGATAFIKTTVAVEVDYNKELLGFEASQTPSMEEIKQADFYDVTYQAATGFYKFSNDAEEKSIRTMLGGRYEQEIKNYLLNNPDLLGKKEVLYLTTSDDVDQLHKGNFPRDIPEERRRINNFQLQVYDALVEQGKIKTKYNNYF